MSADPARLFQALTGRYALERELGQGGMATVFLARDLRYDRPVALKVLHTELAQSLGPERFQREIMFAARLQHPHILTVLDSGDAAGQLWFTMPFVEGESLRQRLRRERQLAAEDAVQIGHAAALALEYAHQHGVIHRDIKPENILITRDGSTLVADFGIARALGSAESQLTETGVVVGTPAYMSPEQAGGDPHLDARTDVNSLGCVLYEMLAGEPPFTGATIQALLVRRLTETPRSIRDVRQTVSPALEQAVFKALARAPADRFATAAQLAQALQPGAISGVTAPVAPAADSDATTAVVAPARTRRRMPVAAVTLGLGFLIGIGVLFAWRRTQPDSAGGTRRVAVLPFENLGAPDDEYFAEGVSDALRGKLAGLPGMAVTARSSASQYKGTSKPMQVIGRELGVDYVLTGTVRWAKNKDGTSRVEVSPELVEVAPGHTPRTRWQQPFGAAMTDVFAVQADIATRVAGALDLALGDSAKKSLADRPTASIPAYDAYLKARSYEQRARLNVEPQTMTIARQLYQDAIAADSGFGLAWARLATVQLYFYDRSPNDSSLRRSAKAAVDRALALSPGAVESHMAAAQYSNWVDADNLRAMSEYERALKIDPNNAEVLGQVGYNLWFRGRRDSSIATMTRAVALDPRSPDQALGLARAMFAVKRYDAADSAYVRAIELAPDQYHAYFERAGVQLVSRGDVAAARRVMHDAETRIGKVEFVKKLCVQCFDWTGPLADDYEAVLDQLSLDEFSPVDSVNFYNARAGRAYMHGDVARQHANADSARRVVEPLVRARSDDPYLPLRLALAQAWLDKGSDALASIRREVELRRRQADTVQMRPDIAEQSARVLVVVGRKDEALDSLAVTLADTTYAYTTRASARVDPFWRPLAGMKRFQELVRGS
jgi:serine/threonine-protein kinase